MQTGKTKQNKFLALVAIFSLPVLLVIFLVYKFSSSKTKGTEVSTVTKNQFNESLPQPKLGNKDKNKLEIYMQAKQDSIDQKQKIERSDNLFDDSSRLSYDPMPSKGVFVDDSPAVRVKTDMIHQERRVNEQLDKITQALHPTDMTKGTTDTVPEHISSTPSPDIVRLEQMLAAMQSAPDSDNIRLEGMVNKLYQLQNPSSSTKKSGDTTKSLPVRSVPQSEQLNSSVFYGLEPEPVNPTVQKSAINAVVHMDQTVQSGSTIKLRLLQDIYVDQQRIPANQFVFGICNISNERLYINLDKIAYNNIIFPIKLQVYDMDGLPGISIPGAITRDAAKEGIDDGFQAYDPSLSGQVANAGIQSMKSLISRKVRTVRATIKAGHQVLLQ